MQDILLPEIIRLHGRWRAKDPAIVDAVGSMDRQTFNQRTDQVANGLASAGFEKGDRVGVVMGNGAAMVEVLIGAIKAGAVVVPLNPSVDDGALEAMLGDAGVKAIVASEDHRDRVDLDVVKKARLCLVSGGARTPPKGWRAYTDWRDAQATAPARVPLTRDDLCNIIYSSGTTGQPKGIVHGHGARLDWAHDLAHALRYHGRARLLIATGLYSNISWAGMLPTLMLGGTLIVRDGFDALDVLKTIERERVTHMSLVPVQYQRLLQHPEFDAHDRSSLQAMMCCGSPLALHTKEALFERFACGVIELYGSTEGIITTLAPEEARGRMASVGRPLPGEDLAILDANEELAAAGQPGEIVALSRFAMEGYWNRPEATRETYWIDPEGRHWLRSGDIGRLDADGYLHITDRKKDMIISGGQNIYPADIEAVLVCHPDVVDCAVFGIPSERWGETPLALVVLRERARPDPETLRDWVNTRLGKQQRLHAVELRSTLPRNANGKLLKRELRAPYWSAVKGALA
jgi:long-chain acyl-CoA synthetase